MNKEYCVHCRKDREFIYINERKKLNGIEFGLYNCKKCDYTMVIFDGLEKVVKETLDELKKLHRK